MPGLEIPLNLTELISYIEAALKPIFGEQPAGWLSLLVAVVVLCVLTLAVVWILGSLLAKIAHLAKEELPPLFYDAEKKHRIRQRRRFADHIESEIRRLNGLEDWKDYKYAELEAEVEAEGRRRSIGLFPLTSRPGSGLRREKALSKALETSSERLVLLEGEPGSGKSVALRYVAQKMAQAAMKARSVTQVMPVYVNLKELVRGDEESIDRNLVERFVLAILNRPNDRDIEEFLDDEFAQGMQEGTWFFLFDSFDEIPEVLSATESDVTVQTYATAISDFLHGMNRCRGVVASRQFRGPGQLGWPRFRILPLSENRAAALVDKADLPPQTRSQILGEIGAARQEYRSMVSNPMFLGLLCDHVRAGNPFPRHLHTVLETYLDKRLTRDEGRVQRRFGLLSPSLRELAETIAFCMMANPRLGLSPTRAEIKGAIGDLGFGTHQDTDRVMDALEYVKLARSETASAGPIESRAFTFAHRRFQEYFATCVLLREPSRVSTRLLLTDARWRESAVVLFQTQSAEKLRPLVEQARLLLSEMLPRVPALLADPIQYVHSAESAEEVPGPYTSRVLPTPFEWPTGSLHLLGLLGEGLADRPAILGSEVALMAARLTLTATLTGTLLDRKWALETCGIVPHSVLLWLLREAFSAPHETITEIAYRQIARLGEIPNDIARSIRQALLSLFIRGHLRRDFHSTVAHVSRLQRAQHFLSVLRLLRLVRPIELILQSCFLAAVTVLLVGAGTQPAVAAFTGLSLLVVLSVALQPMAFFVGVPSTKTRDKRGKTGSLIAEIRSWSRPRAAGVFELLLVGCLIVIRLSAYPVLACVLFMEYSATRLIWLLAAMLFAYAWGPLAIVSVRTGKYCSPAWSAVMPLWLLLYVIGNVAALLNRVRAWLRQITFRKAILVLVLFMGFAGFLAGFLALPLYVSMIIALVLTAAIGLLVIPPMARSIVDYFRDLYRCRGWKLRHLNPMTTDELIRRLGQLRSPGIAANFVRSVRTQGVLSASHESATALRQFALFVERVRVLDAAAGLEYEEHGADRPRLRRGTVLGQIRRLARGLVWNEDIILQAVDAAVLPKDLTESCVKRMIRLGTSARFIDEVYRLLEQTHARSRGSGLI